MNDFESPNTFPSAEHDQLTILALNFQSALQGVSPNEEIPRELQDLFRDMYVELNPNISNLFRIHNMFYLYEKLANYLKYF